MDHVLVPRYRLDHLVLPNSLNKLPYNGAVNSYICVNACVLLGYCHLLDEYIAHHPADYLSDKMEDHTPLVSLKGLRDFNDAIPEERRLFKTGVLEAVWYLAVSSVYGCARLRLIDSEEESGLQAEVRRIMESIYKTFIKGGDTLDPEKVYMHISTFSPFLIIQFLSDSLVTDIGLLYSKNMDKAISSDQPYEYVHKAQSLLSGYDNTRYSRLQDTAAVSPRSNSHRDDASRSDSMICGGLNSKPVSAPNTSTTAVCTSTNRFVTALILRCVRRIYNLSEDEGTVYLLMGNILSSDSFKTALDEAHTMQNIDSQKFLSTIFDSLMDMRSAAKVQIGHVGVLGVFFDFNYDLRGAQTIRRRNVALTEPHIIQELHTVFTGSQWNECLVEWGQLSRTIRRSIKWFPFPLIDCLCPQSSVMLADVTHQGIMARLNMFRKRLKLPLVRTIEDENNDIGIRGLSGWCMYTNLRKHHLSVESEMTPAFGDIISKLRKEGCISGERNLLLTGIHHSTIHLNRVIDNLVIRDCTRSRIFVIATNQSTCIYMCREVEVTVASHFIIAVGCLDLTLNCATTSRPIFTESCRGQSLGPYNVKSSNLNLRLQSIFLPLHRKYVYRFARPIILSKKERLDKETHSFGVYVPPSDFRWNILGENSPDIDVPPLPPPYDKEVLMRQANKDRALTVVSQALEVCEDGANEKVLSCLESYFHNWILSNGHNKRLDECMASDNLFNEERHTSVSRGSSQSRL